MRGYFPGMLTLGAIFVLFAPNGFAEEPAASAPTQRLCTEADMAGTYALVDFRETPEGSETVFHNQFPHQYLAFYPEHLYGMLIINTMVDSPVHLDKQLIPNGKKDKNKKYALGGQGALYLYAGNNIKYSYRCVANLISKGDYQKGDLLLTYYTKNKKHEVFNLYRRWY